LLAHGQWFSPGTPASPTTKTGRHDLVEILLKVALNTKNQIKSNHMRMMGYSYIRKRNHLDLVNTHCDYLDSISKTVICEVLLHIGIVCLV
jgi:hypothetical protein